MNDEGVNPNGVAMRVLLMQLNTGSVYITFYKATVVGRMKFAVHSDASVYHLYLTMFMRIKPYLSIREMTRYTTRCIVLYEVKDIVKVKSILAAELVKDELERV